MLLLKENFSQATKWLVDMAIKELSLELCLLRTCLTQVMEGELDEVIETLQSEDQKLKLEALISAQLGT